MDSKMAPAPYAVLDRWIGHVSIGRALDLGAGDGEVSLWLAELGFTVDAVDRDPTALANLAASASGRRVRCIERDMIEVDLEWEAYSLITAFGSLHFLRPTDLWLFADRVVNALTLGGIFICEVFTLDDPGYRMLHDSGAELIEPNTYRLLSHEKHIHYFGSGELGRIFSELEIHQMDEYRRIDPSSDQGFRAGATFVGEKTRK